MPVFRFGWALSLALAGVAAALSGAAPSRAADPKAGAVLAVECRDCHGVAGISPESTVPNIAGQKEDYLALQLLRFRQAFFSQFGDPATYMAPSSPPRSNVVMDHRAGIGNPDIQNLAAYYAGLSCRRSRPTTSVAMPGSVAFCARCHGDDGVSATRDVPNLAGQKENYLVLQIGAFRQSNVAGPAPFDFPKRTHPVMSEVAEHLTNGEIRALAAWYANRLCH